MNKKIKRNKNLIDDARIGDKQKNSSKNI